jgi:3-hydroxyisobutyrate dehydrogenase
MQKIGFIGLGHMGLPMALGLAKHFPLMAYDQNPKAREEFQAQRGIVATSLADLAKQAEVIITMLPNGEILLAVYTEMMAHIPKKTLVIDCSTIGPLASQEWHTLTSNHDFISVDAPVSGGVGAAKEGRLSFMLGGDEAAVQQAMRILSVIGKKLIHTGGPGSGQAAKICNNLVLGNTMIAVSEAFALASHLNLDPHKLHEVLEISSGDSWVIQNYLPVPNLGKQFPADKDYQAGFSGQMMLKDLRLANEAAHHQQHRLDLSLQSQKIYQTMIDQGKGDKDFSFIYQILKNL